MLFFLKRWGCVSLFSCALTTIGYVCSIQYDDDNKENVCPLNHSLTALKLDEDKNQFQVLQTQLSNLQVNIEQSHNQANVKNLFRCYNHFTQQLIPHYSDQAWKQITVSFKAQRWPLQKSWQEVVGGYLFFPAQRLYQWLETEYTEHLTNRIDMLSAYAIAAKFSHPLGYYYLGERFFKINYVSVNTSNEEIFSIFLDRAFSTLNQYLNHPDVAFAVGRYHRQIGIITANYNEDKADKVFEKGKDCKNQLALLNLQMEWKQHGKVPTVDDYLKLARKNYPAAYLQALNLAIQQNNKTLIKQLFAESHQMNYPHLYILQGIYEGDQGHMDQAKALFKQAVQAGLPYGDIMWGLYRVDHVHYWDLDEIDKFIQYTPEQIVEAIRCFEQAGQDHDPLGYEYLGNIYYKIIQLTRNHETIMHYAQLLNQAWNAGAALGHQQCYFNLTKAARKLYNTHSQLITEDYNFNPDILLAKNFLRFIDEEDLDEIFQ